MVFQKGVSGNPGGRPKTDHAVTAALEEIVDPDKLAASLWALASEGNLAAIKYIYDRIDGSPTQRHEIDDEAVYRECERIARDHGRPIEEVLKKAQALGLRVVK